MMMKKCATALACLFLVGAARGEQKPTKLAEGVWAMMTGAASNAGWFTFGDSVIAVDSGSSPAEAEKILAAIAETTGKKPISYLILTNYFTPHAGGAAAFARKGATVVCHEKFGPTVFNIVNPPAANPAPRTGGPAVMTIAQRMVLQTEGRHVEISHLGPADSGGDLVIYIADAETLFSGDLAETAILPPLFSAAIDPDGWLASLDALQRLKVKSLVPGYGPIGPPEGLKATRFYLEESWDLAKRLAAERTPEDFIATRLKEPDVKMKGLPAELEKSHEANVKALVKMIRSKSPQAPPAP